MNKENINKYYLEGDCCYFNDKRNYLPKSNMIELFEKFNGQSKIIFVYKNEEYNISALHSWRGSYYDLAISIIKKNRNEDDDDDYEYEIFGDPDEKHCENYRNIITVDSLINCLRETDGKSFRGWKGDWFTMKSDTFVHINFGWGTDDDLKIEKIEGDSDTTFVYVT